VVTPETKAYTVDISICSAPKMAKINFAFRKIKTATDILSFPTHEFFQRQGMLGDLVLCAPVALRQAKEIGHTWQKEIDVLLVHGILHLLRFDHEVGEKDAAEMASWESKILGRAYAKSLIQRVHEMPVTTVAKPRMKVKVAAKAKAKVRGKLIAKAKASNGPKARASAK
jgi:probable rRNA maturation factor